MIPATTITSMEISPLDNLNNPQQKIFDYTTGVLQDVRTSGEPHKLIFFSVFETKKFQNKKKDDNCQIG